MTTLGSTACSERVPAIRWVDPEQAIMSRKKSAEVYRMHVAEYAMLRLRPLSEASRALLWIVHTTGVRYDPST